MHTVIPSCSRARTAACTLLLLLAAVYWQTQVVEALSSGNYQIKVLNSNGVGLCLQYAANAYAASSLCTNDTSFTFAYSSSSGYFTAQSAPSACLCPSVSLLLEFDACSSLCTWTVASDGTIRTTAGAFTTSPDQCIAGAGTPSLQACASLTTAYYNLAPAFSVAPASPSTSSSTTGSSPTVTSGSPSTGNSGSRSTGSFQITAFVCGLVLAAVVGIGYN